MRSGMKRLRFHYSSVLNCALMRVTFKAVTDVLKWIGRSGVSCGSPWVSLAPAFHILAADSL